MPKDDNAVIRRPRIFSGCCQRVLIGSTEYVFRPYEEVRCEKRPTYGIYRKADVYIETCDEHYGDYAPTAIRIVVLND